VAAAAGLHAYADFVDEFHMSFCRKDAKTRRKAGRAKTSATTRLRSPDVIAIFNKNIFPLRLCASAANNHTKTKNPAVLPGRGLV
ncbi:MAG: hypothetical protein AAB315_03190, partial [Pseudomonadota bacterium]